MQQISQYRQGERDYTLIKGDTGPLVYPAAHVYIYNLLYVLTDGGSNILLAQVIFGGVYLGVLSVVMACYRLAKVRILILIVSSQLLDEGFYCRHPLTSSRS